MSLTIRRVSLLVAAFLSTALLAQAHPGHDGHDLTWDFGHLVQHPLATFGWALIFVTATWALARLMVIVGETMARSRVRVSRRRD